jgi:hypothetical protein
MLLAEMGYYFVSFVTAVSFIETLKASALSEMDPVEFESLRTSYYKSAGISDTDIFVENNPAAEQNSIVTDESNSLENAIDREGPNQMTSTQMVPPAQSPKETQLQENFIDNPTERSSAISLSLSRVDHNRRNRFLSMKPEQFSLDDIRELLADYSRLFDLVEQYSGKVDQRK